jgi:hypothetical protein
MANTYTLISSNQLASSATSVTFSSIPSTYTDLLLKMSVRGNLTNLATRIRFNNDSSGLYSISDLIGQGNNGVLANRYANNTEMDTTRTNQANSNWTANTFTSIEVYIPNYNSTVGKPFSSFSAAQNNSPTVTNIDVIAALYRGTSAVSSILILPGNSNNFVANSSFHLYGIKNS